MKSVFKYFNIILLIILMVSCSGEDENPQEQLGFFVTFKVDGMSVEYKGLTVGAVINHLNSEIGAYNIGLSASKSFYTEEEVNSFSFIFIQQSSELKLNHDYEINYESIKRDYNDNNQIWRYSRVGIFALYTDDNGIHYSSFPVHHFENFAKQSGFNVRFTSISAEAVEGLFSAKLYNDRLDKSIIISEGKFRLINGLDKY